MQQRAQHLGLADAAVVFAERIIELGRFDLLHRQVQLLEQLDVTLDVDVAGFAILVERVLDWAPDVFGERPRSVRSIRRVGPVLNAPGGGLGLVERAHGTIALAGRRALARHLFRHANLVKPLIELADDHVQIQSLALDHDLVLALGLEP